MNDVTLQFSIPVDNVESHKNENMQSATAQIGGAKIVQFQPAQIPRRGCRIL